MPQSTKAQSCPTQTSGQTIIDLIDLYQNDRPPTPPTIAQTQSSSPNIIKPVNHTSLTMPKPNHQSQTINHHANPINQRSTQPQRRRQHIPSIPIQRLNEHSAHHTPNQARPHAKHRNGQPPQIHRVSQHADAKTRTLPTREKETKSTHTQPSRPNLRRRPGNTTEREKRQAGEDRNSASLTTMRWCGAASRRTVARLGGQAGIAIRGQGSLVE